MRLRFQIPAPTGSRWGPDAFAGQESFGPVRFTTPGDPAVETMATIVDVIVDPSGAYATLTLDLPEETGPAIRHLLDGSL